MVKPCVFYSNKHLEKIALQYHFLFTRLAKVKKFDYTVGLTRLRVTLRG